ncbi:MAG: hypothetical protein EU551_01830 [Promethearchaeota archaeon]|nr:MAG: hypothetical protein EU551_01830 [Candidatus Lokiarchaeota archaeon]
MVNIGILGDLSVGKTSILRLFVQFIEQNMLEEKFNLAPVKIVRTDFSGEATLNNKDTSKQTKTIHPNRVVFQIGNKMHTLFAPGGDDRPLVRMGIITIFRISHIIIAVFDLSRDLENQIIFYDRIKFNSKSIYVVLNKADLVTDLNKKVNEYTKNIEEYFIEKRKINIKDISVIVAEALLGFEDLNANCASIIISCVQMDR